MRSFLLLPLALVISGCAPAEPKTENTLPVATSELDHMHCDHAHAESFPELVILLVKMNDTIRESFASGDAKTADDTLHEIGHQLEDVSSMVKKTSLTEEQQIEVGVAAEKLLDLFGGIDEKVHRSEEPGYDAVSAEISELFQTLQKFAEESK